MSQDLLAVTSQEQLGEKTDWFELLPAELATAATRTSGLQRCTKAGGVMLEIITQDEVGAPTITPKILVPNGAGGTDLVLASFTAIADSGSRLALFHEYATGGDTAIAGALPREWKLQLEYATPDTAANTMDTHVYARYL